MAEGDITVYNNALESMLLALWDFDTDTFTCALVGSGYTFDRTGNPGYAAVSANEISTTGYTAPGKNLTGLTVTQDDTNHRGKWDAADLTWTALGTTAIAHAIVFDNTITTPVVDPLVLRVEIATSSNGNDYTISWHADGIFYLQG